MKFSPISPRVFTSLRLFMELRNVLSFRHSFWMLQFFICLFTCTRIAFIWFLQHLKSSLVNFRHFGGERIEWAVWMMRHWNTPSEREKWWGSQARIVCPMRSVHVHTHPNIESHNMKTIEQQMQNIQQLIPHKLSSVAAAGWKCESKETKRRTD